MTATPATGTGADPGRDLSVAALVEESAARGGAWLVKVPFTATL